MPITTVEEFIAAKVAPELRPVVARLRVLMPKLAPQAAELYTYGLPMWKVTNIIAWISPTKKDITLSFTMGKLFEDKYEQLKGTAKWARFVKLKPVADINQTQLRYYLKQAVAHDKR